MPQNTHHKFKHKNAHKDKGSSISPSTSLPASTESKPSSSTSSSTTASAHQSQCCQEECCVSLTYSRSVEQKEGLIPQLQSASYFCESMNIVKEGNCDIDFIVLPLSAHCNLQRTIYDMQEASGYHRAILENGKITPNNAETFYLSPDDPRNPLNGTHALQFPVTDNQQIAMCTLFDWGNIVDKINDNEVRIGYMSTSAGFSCHNATVRDLCSVSVNHEFSNFNTLNSNTEYQYNDIYIIVMILSSMLIFMAVGNNICICHKWKKSMHNEGDIEQIRLQPIEEETDGDTDVSDDTEEEDEEAYTFV